MDLKEVHIEAQRRDFPIGFTAITQAEDPSERTGMDFGILRLEAGESVRYKLKNESAFLLMGGSMDFTVDEDSGVFSRKSLFDESPSALHMCGGTEVRIRANSSLELALLSAKNTKPFPCRIFYPENVPNEHRGKGQVGDCSYRFVRTIFDNRNSHPDTKLVLGEVVNMPGRWSSYPPHHHPQPEIYHYRFSHPMGYGHGELGNQVLKVRHGDTVKILDNLDHSQCSAPGYAMYYIWVIRHLDDCRYTVPEFTPEHQWTMKKDAILWEPSGVPNEGASV